MTKTLTEAAAFVDGLTGARLPDGVSAFVLPSHTALAAVRTGLDGSGVMVGAQDASALPEGPVTGGVSMRMVRDAGAELVEIGHSERRRLFGETDEDVAAKVGSALANDILPLVCVGETAVERGRGSAAEVVHRQVSAALARVDRAAVSDVLLAYEPVWAIGETGTPAAPDDVAPVVELIHEAVAQQCGRGPRAVLYGGSVNRHNAADLLDVPGVGGLFVGRAAWDVHGFLQLWDIAAWRAGCLRPSRDALGVDR